MKSLLLSALAVFVTASSHAQLNTLEFGLHGGCSFNSVPNLSLYSGTEGGFNYTAGASLQYMVTDNLQIGLGIDVTRWDSKGEWDLTHTNNNFLGTEKVKFSLANPAISYLLRANYVMPFYDFDGYYRSNFYGGAAAGFIMAQNDGRIKYSKVNPNTPVEYTYTSEYHFEQGYGFGCGIQVGYTYFFTNRLGFNAELAARYAAVKTIENRYDYANQKYNLFYFPVTVGLQYRFRY